MVGQEHLERWRVRFAGVSRLYGNTAESLIAKHVVVIGIGGVGSWAAEALVRTGIGEITLIDMDDVCVSNSNRQSHAMASTVGQMKVDVVAQRLRDINPDCTVHAKYEFITPSNTEELLHASVDGVLDCIDSAKAKAHLLHHCKLRKIIVITTGGAGGRIDPTLIKVGDLNKTVQDRLSAKVRTLLRRNYGYSRTATRRYGIPCVHSIEQPVFYMDDGTVDREPGVAQKGRLDCEGGLGAATAVTGAFAFVAAAALVNRLLGRPVK